MPTVGYLLGKKLEEYIEKYDHWVAFALLCLIGANMIRESFSKEEESVDASFSFKAMLVLAFATSVDALAVGISFVTVIPNIPVYIAAPCIGAITFGLSALGLKVGNLFGTRFKNKAELAGGIKMCIRDSSKPYEEADFISLSIDYNDKSKNYEFRQATDKENSANLYADSMVMTSPFLFGANTSNVRGAARSVASLSADGVVNVAPRCV